MARINVYRPADEYEDGPVLEGWFDSAKAEVFEEATRWDGQNKVSAVAPIFHHEALYRTRGGRWVLNHWSQWQGTTETYTFIDDEQARMWLLKCGHDDAVKRYFGAIEEERGPGRPAVGAVLNVRLTEEQRDKLKELARDGEPLAAVIRRLIDQA